MPKRTDLKSILIIGAGPIIIGQACEFDYSGTQACKALREEGYRVILINSNPATIMTDPELADATYIEPITPEFVEKVIAKERPDAVLPTMGGQTALNCALELDKHGIFEKYDCELIGAKAAVIEKAEDRQLFRQAMDKIGLESPRSIMVGSMEEAEEAVVEIGLPIISRPSFTMGGTGGGIAYNREEFLELVQNGLRLSPVGEILLEESVLGWKEFEMEVVRDTADNCIIICSIENIDPMGIHTGDSITVAPALTLTDKEYQIMRNASLAVLREIGVETGGSNVQFAVNPEDGRMVVIEMNPRVSRSSALASKATGFPIAKVAAKLAVGYTLDELMNDITGTTPASFEPAIDYVVTKIPRFTFEKFPTADALLSTSMKSVGEVMSMGRTFQESLQKGLRSMETGLDGLSPVHEDLSLQALKAELAKPVPNRLLTVAQAFRVGMTVEKIHQYTKMDPWFLEQVEGLVATETYVAENGLPETAEGLRKLKQIGFSDSRLANLTNMSEQDVANKRDSLGVSPVFKRVDTCAGEFRSSTSYMYSSYDEVCEADPSDKEKVIILGSGPNRIGQGIEFDYCCVHAVFGLKKAGYETIMVNCNPETVSTDYDTSDRLYFEPLTAENVIEICKREQGKGTLKGVVVQLGGQTPLKLSHALLEAGIPILGTEPDAIDLAEDRERFQKLLRKLKLKQPNNGLASSLEEAVAVSKDVGFPLVIRPSYVLGGRAMEIVDNQAGLERYISQAVIVSGNDPVLLDSYLAGATEVDVDVLCDGHDTYVAGIMEHIEEAGIHSGDSACTLPPHSLSQEIQDELAKQAQNLAKELNVVGLMNAQFAIQGTDIYVLEVNPRASRTVPFVAKATGVAVAQIASRLMAGEKLASFNLQPLDLQHMSLKVPVFPFSRFPGVDVILGPEMKSTGEVMGLDMSFAQAFAKSQLAASVKLPTKGTVFISVKDEDKQACYEAAKGLIDLGFKIISTKGTQKYLSEKGLEVEFVNKVMQGRPNVVDRLVSGDVDLIFNTTGGAQAIADSFSIRETALKRNIPNYTVASSFRSVVRGITALKEDNLKVKSVQEHLAGLAAQPPLKKAS